MLTRIFHFRLALVFALLAALAQLGEASGASSDHVSFAEYRTIVQRCVTAVPDLKALWDWRKKFNEPVYFGGGALRGLIRWVDVQIANGVASAAICAGSAPSVDQLIIPGADRDIFHKRVGADWFKTKFSTYANWDIITEDFFQSGVRAGGCALEKLRIAPDEIDDPFHALEDFHRGILRYVDVPEAVFREFRPQTSRIKGLTKTAQILRTVRFGQDLHLHIPDSDLVVMRADAAFEDKMGLIAEKDWRIEKYLKKLLISSQNDAGRARVRLRLSGAIFPLARKGYTFEGGAELFDSADFDALPYAELLAIKKDPRKISLGVAASEAILRKAGLTPSQFAEAIHPVLTNPTVEYRKALDSMAKRYASNFPAAQASIEDLARLKSGGMDPTSWMPYVESFLDRRGLTLAEFVEAIRPPNPNDADLNALAALINRKIDLFVSLNPTLADLNIAKTVTGSRDGNIALIRAYVRNRQPTLQEYFGALEPGVSKPNERYLADLVALERELVDEFAVTHGDNVTALEYAKAHARSADAYRGYIEAFLARPDLTKAEFLVAVLPTGPGAYRSEIDRVLSKNADRFMKLRPELEDLNEIKRISGSIDVSIKYIDAFAKIEFPSPSDYRPEVHADIFEPGITNPTAEYTRRLSLLKKELTHLNANDRCAGIFKPQVVGLN